MNTFFYFIKNTLNFIKYIPLLLFLFSCEKNNEYTVSVEVLPVESGSIDFLNKFYGENDVVPRLTKTIINDVEENAIVYES